MKWGKRRDTVPSRFLFEMQEEPGEALPEEHIEREEGVGIPIMPMGEASPFMLKQIILPSTAKLSAPPPNEFEAPPF
jgi:hypothetical protein